MEEIVFPNQIRINRKINGVTMQELADKLGVSLSAVSKIEKGYRRLNQEQLILVAETLNCSLQDLYVNEQNSDSEVVQAWKKEQERRQEINKSSGLKLLGAGLRYIRTEKSLTLIEVAENSSMTLSVYHRIEMGQREVSSIEYTNIASALKMDQDTLKKTIAALDEKGLLDEIMTNNETKYKLNNFNTYVNEPAVDDETFKINIYGEPGKDGSIIISKILKEMNVISSLKNCKNLFGVNLCSRRLGGLLSNRCVLLINENEMPSVGDIALLQTKDSKSFIVSIREDDNGILFGKLWNPEETIDFTTNDKLSKVVQIIL